MDRIVHIAKTLLAAVVVHSGLLAWLHRRRAPHVLVLAYHRVTPDAELAHCAYPAMHVSTSSFEAQIVALQALYRVAPMVELQAILAGKQPLRDSIAVISFDDGYRDNYEQALPILARHGVPATFFLSLDFVDRGRSFWFDRLAEAVRAWDADPAARARVRATLPAPLVAALAARGAFRERLRAAAAFLKSLPDAERETAVRTLTAWAGEAAPGAQSLSWEEVHALRESGMHIGAHGVHHAILTRMPPLAAAQEIQRSLAGIGARLGAAVQDFAYPNGDADDRVVQVASGSGVRLGFTMQPRANRPGDDPLRLGRHNVCEDTSRSAFQRFSAPYFWCEITGVFAAVLGRARRQASHA